MGDENPVDLYDRLTEAARPYQAGKRPARAALLIWFLQHVERLDPTEAVDAVLDRDTSSPFDGLWVDESAEEITILEAKWYEPGHRLLQADIDGLAARAEAFTPDRLLDLVSRSKAPREIESLFERESISDRINGGYGLRFVLVTNAVAQAPATAGTQRRRAGLAPIEVWDLGALSMYIRFADRPLYVHEERTLQFAPGAVFSLKHAESAPVVFGALSADQIAALPGIDDKTLFAQNVRLDLGRTRVNKDLAATVESRDEHARFMTFHNGLTILCQSLTQDPSVPERVQIRDFSVVNGCQSALAFFRHQEYLTPDLLVPVRLVQVGEAPSPSR